MTMLHEHDPSTETIFDDVLCGLSLPQKRIPCKYFYDDRGCELFGQICELDEYYLTRTELAIMDRHVKRMADVIGPNCMLIELGSGSGIKTRILLDHLENPVAYVPVDIARDNLQKTANDLNEQFPDLQVLPVCGDFTQSFELPPCDRMAKRKVVYFPGSTVGNLEHDDTATLLRNISALCGKDGGMLIGLDLIKDVKILEAAYDDRKGVTAEFNLNVLHRINRELGGDFQIDQFRHHACYNSEADRIEMYLVSLVDQSVSIGNNEFEFEEGEMICTEYSHKYDLDRFSSLASSAGFDVQQVWTDEQRLFAVVYLGVR